MIAGLFCAKAGCGIAGGNFGPASGAGGGIGALLCAIIGGGGTAGGNFGPISGAGGGIGGLLCATAGCGVTTGDSFGPTSVCGATATGRPLSGGVDGDAARAGGGAAARPPRPFPALRICGVAVVDRHQSLLSTRHPTARPAAMPAATAVRARVVSDVRRRWPRSRLSGGGQSAATAHASRSSAARSRNSSAGSGRCAMSMPNIESSGSTSTSSRSISGSVMLRSSGSAPQT